MSLPITIIPLSKEIIGENSLLNDYNVPRNSAAHMSSRCPRAMPQSTRMNVNTTGNSNPLIASIASSNQRCFDGIKDCMNLLSELVTISNVIFKDIISETEKIQKRLNSCKERVNKLINNDDNTIVTKFYRQQNVETNIIYTTEFPKILKSIYHTIAKLNFGYSQLHEMNQYIHLMPEKYSELKNVRDLYSNRNYFFLSWKDSQLKNIIEMKKKRKNINKNKRKSVHDEYIDLTTARKSVVGQKAIPRLSWQERFVL